MKDSNFFEYNKNSIIPEGKFFTSFSTMVTHGTYEKRGSNEENYNILVNSDAYEDMVLFMESNGFCVPAECEE